jgi:hypothetical protein
MSPAPTQPNGADPVGRAARTAHLIVGVPRSGTSAVAQLLSDAGLSFGDPAHFLDTTVHKHNPNFFEMEWVNQVNNLAVEALGSLYSEDFLPVESDFADPALDKLRARIVDQVRAEFGDAPHIGIKDPRFCFTFPLWRELLEGMGYAVSAVLTLRSEAACRRSNLALEAKWADDRTWSRFYLQSLLGARHFTRDVPTVVIDYDALMADPPGYAAGLQLPGIDLAAATARLDPTLVHQRPATEEGDSLIARVQRDLRDGRLRADAYLDYRTVAALQVTELAPAGVRSCRAEVAAAHELIAELTRQRDAQRLHAEQLAEVVAAKQAAAEHHERHAAELERQRAGLQLHADQLGQAVAAKQAAAEHHEARAGELERVRAGLQQHAEQLGEVVSVKQAALDHHERAAAELERQRAGLQLHAEQLTAVVAAKQSAIEHHERTAAELERQRAGLQLHAEQLMAVVAAKQSAIEHHERTAAELERQRAGLQLHAEQLTAVVAAKQSAIEHHEGRLAEFARERAAQQATVERLTASVGAGERRLAELTEALAAAVADADRLRAQRAVLRAAVERVGGTRSWRWSAPLRRRTPAPLTEAGLRPVTAVRPIGANRWFGDGPTRFVVGWTPTAGRVRVELTLTSAVPGGRAGVYWDAGGPYDPTRRVDLGPVDGPTSLSADLDLTEPAFGFWLEPLDRAGEFEISRLRIFCVGR